MSLLQVEIKKQTFSKYNLNVIICPFFQSNQNVSAITHMAFILLDSGDHVNAAVKCTARSITMW